MQPGSTATLLQHTWFRTAASAPCTRNFAKRHIDQAHVFADGLMLSSRVIEPILAFEGIFVTSSTPPAHTSLVVSTRILHQSRRRPPRVCHATAVGGHRASLVLLIGPMHIIEAPASPLPGRASTRCYSGMTCFGECRRSSDQRAADHRASSCEHLSNPAGRLDTD